MATLHVDILNPKATKILQCLADLEMISIKQTTENNFKSVANKLRVEAANKRVSLSAIKKDPESLKAKRCAKSQLFT